MTREEYDAAHALSSDVIWTHLSKSEDKMWFGCTAVAVVLVVAAVAAVAYLLVKALKLA